MAQRFSNAQNILHRLSHREICKSRPNTHWHGSRKLYENVCPDTTVSDVICPPILMRKFTSDGKYLISFSLSLQSLVLYRFLGYNASTQGDPDLMTDESSVGFSNKFDSYFSQVYDSPLAAAPEILCKDFCLLTNKQHFLILASSTPAAHGGSSAGHNSSSELRCENYTFYLVRLEDGKELDRITFTDDFIFLPHHAGVSLYEDMFAVLSIHHQTIHVFQIKASGKFVPVRRVGQFCYDDDALVVAQQQEVEDRFVRENASDCPQPAPAHLTPLIPLPPLPPTAAASRPSVSTQPAHEYPSGPLSGIHQRLLTFLHRQARSSNDPHAMRNFFVCYEQYANLMLWKMQLLDDQHVLIKFGSLDAIVGARTADSCLHNALFVVYNTHITEIVAVFTNASEHLFQQFEQFCDFFRASVAGAASYGSSSSNNELVREHLRRQIRALAIAKSNRGAAVRRALACLPVNPQLQHESPYLDQAMFAYDEKAISGVDRPKPCFDQPVKFHSRRTGQLKFKISTGPARFERSVCKRFATYVFHPVLPFAMSMQHAGVASPVVNFHFRC